MTTKEQIKEIIKTTFRVGVRHHTQQKTAKAMSQNKPLYPVF